MLDAPVWVRGEVVGVLCHEHIGRARIWSAEEIDFVSALASMVSLALEESGRAQSEHLLRESEERFSKAFRSQPGKYHNFAVERQKIHRGQRCIRSVVRVEPGRSSWAGFTRVGYMGEPRGSRRSFLAIWNATGRCARLSASFGVGGALSIQSFNQPTSSKSIASRTCWSSVLISRNASTPRPNCSERSLEKRSWGSCGAISSPWCRTSFARLWASSSHPRKSSRTTSTNWSQANAKSICNRSARIPAAWQGLWRRRYSSEASMPAKWNSNRLLELGHFTRRLVDEVFSATDRRCPIDFLAREIPAEIQADERLLRHIFTNLLTNAVKYSEAGRVVRFEVGHDRAEIVCVICDQGIGIPEADREWLFNAFHRGHNVADRPGTGLGLVIVKRCVDLQGGKIEVESKLGEGTSVTVRLPMFSPSTACRRWRAHKAAKRLNSFRK